MKNAPPYGHEEWFRIRTHEIDRQKTITIPSLLMLMQEASMQNVLKLKLSVWDLEEDKISWVLLRKEVTIKRLPGLGEKIKIITYPAGFERVFAYRDFWVYSEKDELMTYASSTWTLLNTDTRRLQRIPTNMLEIPIPEGKDRLTLPKAKLEIPISFSKQYGYTIHHFDLDWNNHVNNVVLSRLMLQSLDIDYYHNYNLSSLIFHIKNECYLNEQLTVHLEAVDTNEFAHKILGKNDKVIAIAKSSWC